MARRPARGAARWALLLAGLAGAGTTTGDGSPPDLIVHSARITTQVDGAPEVAALAVRDGLVVATGSNAAILPLAGSATRVIDAGGRRVIPGLNDSHVHLIRGGRYYATELRWDGVPTLAEALRRVAEQARRTPPGEWVRVVGGFSPYQFAERRLPTPAELSAAAPATPVFVLHLYSGGIYNRKALEVLGITAATPAPPGGRFELGPDGQPTGRLLAEPNPTILYQAVGRLGDLPLAERILSTRHFYRELNRFGLTSAIDAGGGGHRFPDDYAPTRELARAGDLPLRIAYYLFAQKPGTEVEDYTGWIANYTIDTDTAEGLPRGYVLTGAGENLAWSAGDFENFRAPRPDISANPGWERDLDAVVTRLVRARWPIRIHATYDESINHILDVFAAVDARERTAGRPGFAGLRWAIDHAETATPATLTRIKALGGGVLVQDRMAYAGEDFVARYGAAAAGRSPPLRALLDLGIPVGAGTDGTRVSSYNPWVSLAWFVTGRSVGGTQLLDAANRLSRAEALRLYTLGSAWFSGEDDRKGRLAPGQYADFAILDADFFSIPDRQIARIESLLTVTGGRVVYARGPWQALDPPLPPLRPAWSPVNHFGGYAAAGAP